MTGRLGERPAQTTSEREGGFTLVEILVAMTIFSAVSAGIFGVMFSATRSSETTRRIAGVSEQARLGLNRMIRDTREGSAIDAVATDLNSFEVHVDFDGNNVITSLPGTNSLGDLEELTYKYDPATKTLRLNGEVLVTGVECARDSAGTCRPSRSAAAGSSSTPTRTGSPRGRSSTRPPRPTESATATAGSTGSFR